MSDAWLSVSLASYGDRESDAMLGDLVREQAESGFSPEQAQRFAWTETLEVTRQLWKEISPRLQDPTAWTLLFEFEIPRRQRRPDLVLLAEDVIFVIELKTGSQRPTRASRWQAEEYALDLRDFHAGSAGRRIVPMLVSLVEEPEALPDELPAAGESFVAPVQLVTPDALPDRVWSLFEALHVDSAPLVDAERWIGAPYRPALNIIEAAEQLYAEQTVREITHAYADNLVGTCEALVEIIETAQRESKRIACFVTGVPGSGKTLAGLSAAHDPRLREEGRPAGVFLSGNSPLVKVVRKALAIDHKRRRGGTVKEALREVSTFIQTMQSFVKEHGPGGAEDAPAEHVIIFDEAQRAWDAEHMLRKKGIEQSEPEIILDIMERCPEWAVIIGLVGGGQEIHTGEAGLAQWGLALSERTEGWEVSASLEVLPDAPQRPGGRLLDLVPEAELEVQPDARLHLGVSVRTPRAQRFADWVELLLEARAEEARDLLRTVGEFPLVITRDLDLARAWLLERAGPDRRCGLIASSGARRLRAYGVELSSSFRRGIGYDDWFLAHPDDVRSSQQLEVAASQFECQGLELDWVGLCWGGDLIAKEDLTGWDSREFKGSRWNEVSKAEPRQFLLNRYRVLLTRARDGMVIWVPPGRPGDSTLDPGGLDATARMLELAGVEPLMAELD